MGGDKPSEKPSEKYSLTISRTTIDKLGVKLYDKASDVVSELVANSYDADAGHVTIKAPLGEFLATKGGGKATDRGLEVTIEDDGHGFTSKEANDFYLKVGSDRRTDRRRGAHGSVSRKGRKVMGRKGIGKLAPFGICKRIDVWSSSLVPGTGKYRISHFVLEYDKLDADVDDDYHPVPGPDDGKIHGAAGTRITLSDFHRKKIPDRDTFKRQLERKFGIKKNGFKINVVDTTTGEEFPIGPMELELQEETRIDIKDRTVDLYGLNLPVTGWVAYAKKSHQNEEYAGIRIYARGKLAATTRDFGRRSGFTGEFKLGSYVTGEIHADWLDDEEDLIASDRQDILWSSDRGEALKEWGQGLIKELARRSSEPVKKRLYERFVEKSGLPDAARKEFGTGPVYDSAMEVGRWLAGSLAEDDLAVDEFVVAVRDLILAVAPHKTIIDKLRKIPDSGGRSALDVIAGNLGDAMLAEALSLAQIARERLRAIKELEEAIEDGDVDEKEMQKLLERAPWLIEPQWTVLQKNKVLRDLKERFARFVGRRPSKSGGRVSKYGGRRPDFVMLQIKRSLVIVEIKKPNHKFNDEDNDRLLAYNEVMEEFIKEEDVKSEVSRHQIILICDGVSLSTVPKRSFKSLVDDKILQRKTWEQVLSDTRQAHRDFLDRDKAADEAS